MTTSVLRHGLCLAVASIMTTTLMSAIAANTVERIRLKISANVFN